MGPLCNGHNIFYTLVGFPPQMHVIACVARYVTNRGPQVRMLLGTPTAGSVRQRRAPREPWPLNKLYKKHTKISPPPLTAPACAHLGR